VRRTVPSAVERLVMRCLEKRPADRWQSAAEFVHALDNLPVSDTGEREAKQREAVEHKFRLTEDVCRKLNRATLDPRIIGDEVLYLDNHVVSDVLVFYLHGMGLDHTSFEATLRASPYRGIAVSLYVFAPASKKRIPLALDDHATIVTELIHDVVRRENPTLTVLAGFSSGGDLGFHIVGRSPIDQPLPIDAFLSLGCNLSLETCFVSRPFADLTDHAQPSVDLLRGIDAHVLSVQEWMYLHDYLVRILRKFVGDLSALQRHAQDVVRMFQGSDPHPFDKWYRDATARVDHVRCVFEDTPVFSRLVQDMKLRNMDHGVLGPRYRAESLVMEPAIEHFGLTDPALVQRHIEALVASCRTPRDRTAPTASLRDTEETRIGA
jgi:hypothetical protein